MFILFYFLEVRLPIKSVIFDFQEVLEITRCSQLLGRKVGRKICRPSFGELSLDIFGFY